MKFDREKQLSSSHVEPKPDMSSAICALKHDDCVRTFAASLHSPSGNIHIPFNCVHSGGIFPEERILVMASNIITTNDYELSTAVFSCCINCGTKGGKRR